MSFGLCRNITRPQRDGELCNFNYSSVWDKIQESSHSNYPLITKGVINLLLTTKNSCQTFVAILYVFFVECYSTVSRMRMKTSEKSPWGTSIPFDLIQSRLREPWRPIEKQVDLKMSRFLGGTRVSLSLSLPHLRLSCQNGVNRRVTPDGW